MCGHCSPQITAHYGWSRQVTILDYRTSFDYCICWVPPQKTFIDKSEISEVFHTSVVVNNVRCVNIWWKLCQLHPVAWLVVNKVRIYSISKRWIFWWFKHCIYLYKFNEINLMRPHNKNTSLDNPHISIDGHKFKCLAKFKLNSLSNLSFVNINWYSLLVLQKQIKCNYLQHNHKLPLCCSVPNRIHPRNAHTPNNCDPFISKFPMSTPNVPVVVRVGDIKPTAASQSIHLVLFPERKHCWEEEVSIRS